MREPTYYFGGYLLCVELAENMAVCIYSGFAYG